MASDPGQQRGYLQGGPVGFGQAITEAFKNTFTYQGRASRSAYWWFALFDIILLCRGHHWRAGPTPSWSVIIYVIVFFVNLWLAVRRLHDTDRSGFWWLIGLIPLIGAIVLLVFYCCPAPPGRTGTADTAPVAAHPASEKSSRSPGAFPLLLAGWTDRSGLRRRGSDAGQALGLTGASFPRSFTGPGGLRGRRADKRDRRWKDLLAIARVSVTRSRPRSFPGSPGHPPGWPLRPRPRPGPPASPG